MLKWLRNADMYQVLFVVGYGCDGKQMLEVAGVQVPVRLKQQLEQERQAVEERAHRSPVASKVEDGPRLTHKLLRVLPIHILFWYMPVAH